MIVPSEKADGEPKSPKLAIFPGREPISTVVLPGEDPSRARVVFGNNGGNPFLLTPFTTVRAGIGYRVQVLYLIDDVESWRERFRLDKGQPEARTA